ncbi:MAG: hypothetical protein AB7P08_18610 [Burkholderiales bacterium]
MQYLDQAEAVFLTLESLALAASAILGTATKAASRERPRFERARLSLSSLPERAQRLAAILDAPGGARFARLEQMQDARDAIDELSGEVGEALAALRILDSHGDLTDLGTAAIHSDIVLTVLVEQLERADATLKHALGEFLIASTVRRRS